MSITSFAKNLGKWSLDVILPPRCLSCGEMVGAQGYLCLECWQGVSFVSDPLCACCGLPFEFDVGSEALCAICAVDPPVYHKARTIALYEEESVMRELILAFKHGDKLHLAPALGKWLAQTGRDLLADADLVVPVPLHWRRRMKRRYNQALLLAESVADCSDVALGADMLKRVTYTALQDRVTRDERLRSTKGAFVINPRRAEQAVGKKIVLIDDVMTTGATVSECAKALLQAGAQEVRVLTLARVILNEHL